MTTEAVRTEHIDRAAIAEALTDVCHRAKRDVPAVGTAEYPTPWDKSHDLLDFLLDDWLAADD